MVSCKNECEDVRRMIENDEYLFQFILAGNEKGFNPQSSLTVSSLSASEQLARLTKGISALEKELQNLICNNHNNLVSQGTWIYRLENTLENMRLQSKELLLSMNTVRRKIIDPYEEIQKQCLVLTRLHESTNLLRCIHQVQELSKRISNNDMVAISTMMKEVDQFCEDVDLSDIDIIEGDRKKIENERQNIWKKARSNLSEALNNEDLFQADISIQVFINLNILVDEIKVLNESALAAVTKNAKLALDIQSLSNQSTDQDKIAKLKSFGPGRVTGNTFPGVNVAAFRSKLWSNWANLLETVMYPRCVHIYILQVIIAKRNQTSVELNSCDEQLNAIVESFWNQAKDILSKQLISSSETSTFIKQALEIEYPRLLRLHNDLIKKLQKLTKKYPMNSSKTSCRIFHNDNHFASLFENAYLSRSVSRLLDVVHSMFSSEGLPTTEHIDKLIKMLSDELKLSLIDENLCRTVVRNIGKAIRVFCLNCEQLVVNNGNSSQVIDVANTTQQINVNIANTVLYMKRETENIFVKVPPKLAEFCRAEINKEFAHADELVNNIILPIVDSISEAIESIILTMHRENYQIDSQESVQCSLYMKELQRFISRTYDEYLKPFQHQALLQKHCLNLATKCVDLFLRHICLVRPISPAGRQKIAEDFKNFEVAVSPLCSEINNLGENYKILRTFRPVILLTDAQLIAENEFVGKIIPYSLILMHLYSFAPNEMPAPHESCNWSVARLSQWLDKHPSEHERLELISGALQRYQQNVRQQNKTTFHELYPVMTNLLENGFKNLKL